MGSRNRPIVEIYDEQIIISDDHGEIVTWVEDEWIEDPSVAMVICRYLVTAYEEGTDAVRDACGHWVSADGVDYYRRVSETNAQAHARAKRGDI